MQVGTTKDQGLYNKPSAAVHPVALAAGTLPQYNKMYRNASIYSEFYVFCGARNSRAVEFVINVHEF